MVAYVMTPVAVFSISKENKSSESTTMLEYESLAWILNTLDSPAITGV